MTKTIARSLTRRDFLKAGTATAATLVRSEANSLLFIFSLRSANVGYRRGVRACFSSGIQRRRSRQRQATTRIGKADSRGRRLNPMTRRR